MSIVKNFYKNYPLLQHSHLHTFLQISPFFTIFTLFYKYYALFYNTHSFFTTFTPFLQKLPTFLQHSPLFYNIHLFVTTYTPFLQHTPIFYNIHLILIFAPYIAKIFTYSENAAHLTNEIVLFLRITAISYPAVAIGPVSSSVFQGIGLGFRSLTLTLLRTIFLMLPLTIIFAYLFKLGIAGVWWGISTANLTLAIVGFTWVNLHIKKLMRSA